MTNKLDERRGARHLSLLSHPDLMELCVWRMGMRRDMRLWQMDDLRSRIHAGQV